MALRLSRLGGFPPRPSAVALGLTIFFTASLVYGPATAVSSLERPPSSSVSLDPSPDRAYAFGVTRPGRLAIADFARATLALYAPDGKRERVLAGPGRGYGELIRPLALAVSDKDNIFVYDIGKAHLLRFDRDGNCVADQFQPKSSVSCSFAVKGEVQYRAGGLVLPDKRLCPVYSTDLAGTSQFRPMVCWDSREDFDIFGFDAGCGYVDTISGEIYVAIPAELRVRVTDPEGKQLHDFRVGGPRAKPARLEGMNATRAAIGSELWAWHARFTFVDGLALLRDRIAVLVQDAEPDFGWRLEIYSLQGKLLATFAVANGAMKYNRSVRLASDHQKSVFILVRQPEERGAPRYRVDTYQFLDM